MFRSILASTACAVVLGGAAIAEYGHSYGPDVQLPNANIGECYQLVRIEPHYETIMRSVVVSDSYEIYDVTEPHIELRTERYVKRDSAMRYRVTEPVYDTVNEQVQIRPSYVRYEVTPAEHKTISERILVKEARMVWRRGYIEGAQQVRHDPETGEVWCLVEEPAVYETVHRTVVTRPAEVHETPVEPEYTTLSREVLVRPATVEEVPIPAEYGEYTYEVLTRDGEIHTRYAEEQTEQVATYKMISQQRFEWRLVDCAQIKHQYAPSHDDKHDKMSRMIEVPEGNDPYDRHDWDESESKPVASNKHPGARNRRRVRH